MEYAPNEIKKKNAKEKKDLSQINLVRKNTCKNFTMVSLGLASFFSVGALLKSSAGSTLSQLLYFPEKQKYIK